MDQQQPEQRSCGFIVFREWEGKTQFLLMQHADRWDLPKGHVDTGETDHQCALRELDEETAIKRKDVTIDSEFRFVHRYHVVWDGKRVFKELVIFLAKLHGDVEIVVTEHLGYRWFDWNPVHQLETKTIDGLLQQVDSYWQGK